MPAPRSSAEGISPGVTRASRRRLRTDEPEGLWRRLVDALLGPRIAAGVLVAACFAIIASVIVLWTTEQPLVAVGRVMDETRMVRVPLELEDRERTEENRQAARQATPRVYVAIEPQLDEVRTALENLPKTLSGVETLAEVAPELRDQFALTDELLAAAKGEASSGAPGSGWLTRVAALTELLKRRPLLDDQAWQRSVQEGTHTTVRLVFASGAVAEVYRGELVNADRKDKLADAMTAAARDAGFTGPLRTLVVNRLTLGAKPTFRFDAEGTARDQNAAADAVATAKKVTAPGQVIFQRGEPLTSDKAALYRAEIEHFQQLSPAWRVWLRRGALALAVGVITLTLVGYTVLFCPRVRRNGSRMAGMALVLSGAIAFACIGTATYPQLGPLTAITPTVFVALLISIGYDRRAALAYALLQGLVACIALHATIGTMATMISAIACVVTFAREIRGRNALLRLSFITAACSALSLIGFGLIERPLLLGGALGGATDSGLIVLREILQDAGLLAAGILVVGSATLFILPLLERLFDVATGMTLMELRDPRQPLLRELQVRAPGTYNHSLNVAALAEAAAEAIGGDALLTYVGALYHDVGKMSKPDYFVENQVGGPSKHDKLSPAMSLLVVVGHVKDGLELAREYRLPRGVQHFIEAHHGTTLVEYFYHRARQQAQARRDGEPDDVDLPEEFEYRYPGPRPQTREAACLMICDAVESASRAMTEPTPARIDALVRSIANKRLLDGQFDDCELTLRDLARITESVSRTLAGMYHGRIAYPGGVERDAAEDPAAPRTGEVPPEARRA